MEVQPKNNNVLKCGACGTEFPNRYQMRNSTQVGIFGVQTPCPNCGQTLNGAPGGKDGIYDFDDQGNYKPSGSAQYPSANQPPVQRAVDFPTPPKRASTKPAPAQKPAAASRKKPGGEAADKAPTKKSDKQIATALRRLQRGFKRKPPKA